MAREGGLALGEIVDKARFEADLTPASSTKEIGPSCLKWMSAQGEKTYALGAPEVVIGRKSDADLVLSDPYISRRHAKLIKTPQGYSLVDLESTHGCFVNGERIQRRELRSGDTIVLGKGRVTLHYLVDKIEGIDEPTLEDRDPSLIDLTSVFPSAYSSYSDLEKLSFLLDFQYNLGKNFSAKATFGQILASALKISGAERGFILLDQNEEDFDYVVGMDGAGKSLAQSEFVQASRTVVRQVASSGQPVFMTEGIDGDLALQQSIVAMNLRALACMPLKWIESDTDPSPVRGILYLDSTKVMHALSGLDQKILGKLALEASNVFEKLKMIAALEERKRFEKELALARETQRSLLPQSLPEVDGYRVHAFSQPTRHVGGDFYDFPDSRPGQLTGVLADVSGKGISAALLGSLLQGALDMEARRRAAPHKALNQVNKFLHERTQSNRFVTLFLFQLEQDGSGTFISAGHTTAYLYRAASREVEALEPQHMILGAFASATYESHPLMLSKSDVLVVYSDGLTEAENAKGEMFGEPALVDLIREHGVKGAEALETIILDSIEEFTEARAQTDDITLMLVQRTK